MRWANKVTWYFTRNSASHQEIDIYKAMVLCNSILTFIDFCVIFETMEKYEYNRSPSVFAAKNRLIRGLAAGAGIVAIAATGIVAAQDVQEKSKTPINCYLSPPAEAGDTEFSLSREAYPKLDEVDPSNVDIAVIPGTIEGVGDDGILNQGDTVRVCLNN